MRSYRDPPDRLERSSRRGDTIDGAAQRREQRRDDRVIRNLIIDKEYSVVFHKGSDRQDAHIPKE